jgi:hypothetical protein
VDEYRYFRGLNGDFQANGNPRDESVATAASSNGATGSQVFPDDYYYAGLLLEHRQLDAAGVGEYTVDQHVYGHTVAALGDAGPFNLGQHNQVRMREIATTTGVTIAGKARASLHTVTRVFDPNQGVLLSTQDGGDVATGVGPTCTQTTYAWNLGTWIIDVPRLTWTWTGTCSAGGDVDRVNGKQLSRHDVFYDAAFVGRRSGCR